MASQALRTIAAAWPKDPLRPTVSLASALEKRASRSQSGNERAIERETVLLRRLANSEYQKKYPLSPGFTTPASSPSYYTDLVAELEQAPSRGWLARKLESWKKVVRFS